MARKATTKTTRPRPTAKKQTKLPSLRSKFRLWQVAVVMVVFGAIGSYFVFSSHAATSGVPINRYSNGENHALIQNLNLPGWPSEGVAFWGVTQSSDYVVYVTPMWNGLTHYYTTDPGSLQAIGWSVDSNPGFFGVSCNAPGSTRLFVLQSGNQYLFTLNQGEAGWPQVNVSDFCVYPSNPATMVTNNSAPTGFVDHVGCDYIAGWTQDPDTPDTSNDVHIYINGEANNLGRTTEARWDIGGNRAPHGYWWNLPDKYKQPGATYSVDVYGIDFNSAGQYDGSRNARIGGGTYSCAAAPTPAPQPPSGPTNTEAPIGVIDVFSCDLIQGWAIDYDSPSRSNHVHVYVNNQIAVDGNLGPTSLARPDVNSAYSVGGNHGFSYNFKSKYSAYGTYNVSVYYIDADSNGDPVSGNGSKTRIQESRTLTCGTPPATGGGGGGTVTPPAAPVDTKAPYGVIDTSVCSAVSGWTMDDDKKDMPTHVHVYVNGQIGKNGNMGPTTINRSDVQPGSHGFSYNLGAYYSAGTYSVDVYAIGIKNDGNIGTLNTLLGTKSVTCAAAPTSGGGSTTPVTPAPTNTGSTTNGRDGSGQTTDNPSTPAANKAPFGFVDVINCNTIQGWSIDPDNVGKPAHTHIYVDGKILPDGNMGPTKEQRDDVNKAYPPASGAHGFNYTIPASLRSRESFMIQIFAYDIDKDGTPIGQSNSLLTAADGSNTWTMRGCNSGKEEGSNNNGGSGGIKASPTVTPAANNVAPAGVVDAYECTILSGWTIDDNARNTPTQVHVYIDGKGPGIATVGVARPDVAEAFKEYGVSGNHGFTYDVLSGSLGINVKDGNYHTFDIYAIDLLPDGSVGPLHNRILTSTYKCDGANKKTELPPPPPVTTPAAKTDSSTPSACGYKRTLKKGDSGDEVLELKQRLLAMNFPLDYLDGFYDSSPTGYRIPSDGSGPVYTDNTAVLVTMVQLLTNDAGVSKDGIYGPQTACALSQLEASGFKFVRQSDSTVRATAGGQELAVVYSQRDGTVFNASQSINVTTLAKAVLNYRVIDLNCFVNDAVTAPAGGVYCDPATTPTVPATSSTSKTASKTTATPTTNACDDYPPLCVISNDSRPPADIAGRAGACVHWFVHANDQSKWEYIVAASKTGFNFDECLNDQKFLYSKLLNANPTNNGFGYAFVMQGGTRQSTGAQIANSLFGTKPYTDEHGSTDAVDVKLSYDHTDWLGNDLFGFQEPVQVIYSGVSTIGKNAYAASTQFRFGKNNSDPGASWGEKYELP